MSAWGALPTRATLRLQVGSRVRAGWARVRSSWALILQASLAAGIAYGVGQYVFGHEMPFFAPVAAWIALGFSRDRSVRRVAELAGGVAIGVAAGDLVVHLIGSGLWQMSLVLAASALLGRFLDRGPLLTTQAGVQAIVIVGLPQIGGGPFGRWIDAFVGGLVALAFALLTPTDPRRHPRTLAQAAVQELATVLHGLARGLRTRSVEDVEAALLTGRASQPALDEWRDSARAAAELVRLAPAHRRHRAELERLVDEAAMLDRAMRNARVLVRRSVTAVDDAPAASGHVEQGLAGAVEATAHATDDLATALGTGHDPRAARTRLLEVAGALDPHVLAPEDWKSQSLVMLLRSLVVDLLEASGATPHDARAALPEL
ncbi:membrane protein-like protein [Cellulomonas flavigena DSM 20109]|uniref:Membrane protein-like protein n=1 Tax=Cellulomonas flavigena (strain ATCC 482 / DSM 20109 / BCRC 11376 / JCM 18109 / NBRC 3775 / NCIMB 8073 / NRS 134) TaxID=446466 RepID=D5UL86_CELFN|nr:FUSC family protein [Cellulomonas flavigena]ADG75968.1 membrane protein-like protein [Cellulomonas flavigena DSM 20109]